MGFNFETISQVDILPHGGLANLADVSLVGTRQCRASSGMVTR